MYGKEISMWYVIIRSNATAGFTTTSKMKVFFKQPYPQHKDAERSCASIIQVWSQNPSLKQAHLM